MEEEFTGIGLIEKDTHEDVMWTWVFPSFPPESKAVVQRRICTSWESSTFVPFFYSRFQNQWNYSFSEDINLEKLPKVTRMAIVLIASDFNPEKYFSLCRVLMKLHKKVCNPATLLENYLNVFTKGSCSADGNGTFKVLDYDKSVLFANSKLKDIVCMFRLETILIYTALLLKKRVVVYHPLVERLADICRSLPTFVCHRQNWNILFPFVSLSDDELNDLKKSSPYVAGFVDSRIENRSDLYDVFVNSYSKEITVASHAKDSFVLGKMHKDIATFMVELAESEDSSDIQCIKEVSRKTKELLNNLKSFATEYEPNGKPVITLDSFKEKKMPSATSAFLINLAAAEGMLKL